MKLSEQLRFYSVMQEKVKIISVLLVFITVNASYAQIKTSEVKVLSTNNETIVNGKVSIGVVSSSPIATLDVLRGMAILGTAVFRGTERHSHSNFSSEEDTYIRGGKANSNVVINDGGGNVGIGTTTPDTAISLTNLYKSKGLDLLLQ